MEVYGFYLNKKEMLNWVYELLEDVGLNCDYVNCYFYEFSGGQCQCIGIVRVLVLNSECIIVDEFIFVLDVFVQV